MLVLLRNSTVLTVDMCRKKPCFSLCVLVPVHATWVMEHLFDGVQSHVHA